MISKRNALLLTVVLLLATAIYFVGSHSQAYFTIGEQDFRLRDTADIRRIEIEKQDDKLLLTRHENMWLIGEKYKANQLVINNILRIMQQLNIKNPVSLGMKDSILNRLKNKGTKLSFYSRSKQLAMTVLPYPADKTAVYALLENSNKPFVIYMPAYSYSLTKTFTTKMNYWRNRIIFQYQLHEIADISIDYKGKPNKSFLLHREEEGFSLYRNNLKGVFGVDKETASFYLSGFNYLTFSGIEDNISAKKRDSILNSEAEMTIILRSKKKEVINLKLFLKASKNPNEAYDLDKLYGNLNGDSTLLIIKYYDIDPILKEYDYFRKR